MMRSPHPRPQVFTPSDILVGVLAATAVQLQRPAALDLAAKSCEALFADYPAPDSWHPAIDPEHAKAAITFAGRAFKLGELTKAEYDFVCTKARRAIILGLTPRRIQL